MKEMVKIIDKKVEELSENLKKSTDYLNNIVTTIEKLSSDKINALAQSNFINGAMSAYKNMSSELKKVLGIEEEVIEIPEATIVENEEKDNG